MSYHRGGGGATFFTDAYQDTDKCWSDPCLNGGVCENVDNTRTCYCTSTGIDEINDHSEFPVSLPSGFVFDYHQDMIET